MKELKFVNVQSLLPSLINKNAWVVSYQNIGRRNKRNARTAMKGLTSI